MARIASIEQVASAYDALRHQAGGNINSSMAPAASTMLATLVAASINIWRNDVL